MTLKTVYRTTGRSTVRGPPGSTILLKQLITNGMTVIMIMIMIRIMLVVCCFVLRVTFNNRGVTAREN